ncbi:MAG: sel1 repeat family protein [Prevotella sp.]|nr:sel1 repeat family protein [Prevotella sp.]
MKRIIFMLLVFSSISAFSQKEIKVVSFKQSSSDISARTNQREDPKGEACALVKVQLPQRNALFEGDIIGEIAFKTNEYWVYMPQKSTQLEIKLQDCKPLKVDFINYDIPSLESKGTYELCIIKEAADSPQLYNEGMTALAKNDIVTAFEKLEKAYDAGYAPAAYELGQASLVTYDRNYDEDPNTTESYQEAYNYYKKAAEGGSPEAQYALGAMLLDFQNKYPEELSKIKVDPPFLDKSKIWNLIKNAADKGVVNAQYQMLADDKWCEENANNGNPVALFGMGLRNDSELSYEEYWMLESTDISSSENFEKAAEWYQKAAEIGLDAAQWRLGELYARGLGVKQDINKAIEFRTKAAEQGNTMFQFMMGIMYATGGFADYSTYMFPDGYVYNVEIPQDTEKADKWLRSVNHRQLNKTEKDRLEGNGLLSFTLNELSDGFMKQSKYEKAIYWYQREAEMGYRDAFCNLGEIYLEGKGISKDYQKARMMFEKAILDDEHYGDGYSGQLKSKALCYLGIIYRDGLGVSVNKDKAKELLYRALEEGYDEAKNELEKIN